MEADAVVSKKDSENKRLSKKPQTLEDKMAWNVTVDHDKCTGDGECVDVCPVEVYELQDG